MFYRFGKGDVRLAIDLDDLYLGSAVFIAGGAPSLAKFAADLGELPFQPPVLAINNAGVVVPHNLWVGGDKPVCYSESILCDPVPMKFAVISRRKEIVNGRPWAEWPNTYFFGTSEGFTNRNLLDRHRDLVWWKNTFFIALQLAYRLGFRSAYLVGCGFTISKSAQYAWETKLNEVEIAWNTRLYNDTVTQLENLMPHFQERGLEVVSCTPESAANSFLEFRDHNEVLAQMLKALPACSTVDKPHSSRLGEPKKET